VADLLHRSSLDMSHFRAVLLPSWSRIEYCLPSGFHYLCTWTGIVFVLAILDVAWSFLFVSNFVLMP
jgi:hypothetical protein